MGIVYKAEDKVLNTVVALKIIHPLYSKNPKMINRFKQETLLARSVSHENVVRIHDIGEFKGIFYLTMDFVHGKNLREIIRSKGPLPIPQAIETSKQICRALEAAHQNDIVHRDLKPHNILVDKNGRIMVSDFGIARSLGDVGSYISEGIVGTPAYMSPEQGSGEEVDKRSDIYSFGVILYEMLTGARPFEADDRAGYIRQHKEQSPKPPSEINPYIPESMEKIILKCLEKDRSLRPQTAQEILKNLDHLVLGYRNKIFQTIIKYKYLLGGFLLLLVLGLVGYLKIWKNETSWLPPDGSGKIPIAVMKFENNTGNPDLDHWRRALQNYLIYDLFQSRYLHVIPADRLFQIFQDLKVAEFEEIGSATLDQIAVKTGVHYFILGNFAMAGEELWITTTIRKAEIPEIIGTDRVIGKGFGDITDSVDELTGKIKLRLELTSDQIADDVDKQVGDIASRSPEAWDFYLEGKSYILQRKNDLGIASLEKAVALDPEFALAYLMLSEVHELEQNYDLQKEYIQKALEHDNRVSERYRLFIQGWAAAKIHNSYQKALEFFKEWVKLYPDDAEGNKYVAWALRMQGEWDQALDYYRIVLDSSESTLRANAVENMCFIYMKKGNYDAACEIMLAHEDLFSNKSWLYRTLANVRLCQGRYDLAKIEVGKALELEPDYLHNIRVQGNLFVLEEDFESAAVTYQTMIDQEDIETNLLGLYWMINLRCTQGKFKEARLLCYKGADISRKEGFEFSELDFYRFLIQIYSWLRQYDDAHMEANRMVEQALELDFDDWLLEALHWRAIANLETGDVEGAKSQADRLRDLAINKLGDKSLLRFYLHLQGKIAQKKGLMDQAIRLFKEAYSLLPEQSWVSDDHARFLDALANAYYYNQDFENARKTYKQISQLISGRLTWGEIYTNSFYMLAKISNQLGQEVDAVTYFQKYLRLMSGADPEVTEVEEARQLLEELQN